MKDFINDQQWSLSHDPQAQITSDLKLPWTKFLHTEGLFLFPTTFVQNWFPGLCKMRSKSEEKKIPCHMTDDISRHGKKVCDFSHFYLTGLFLLTQTEFNSQLPFWEGFISNGVPSKMSIIIKHNTVVLWQNQCQDNFVLIF